MPTYTLFADQIDTTLQADQKADQGAAFTAYNDHLVDDDGDYLIDDDGDKLLMSSSVYPMKFQAAPINKSLQADELDG